MNKRPTEVCVVCSRETGKAGPGDGSLYVLDGDLGPLCEPCYDSLFVEFWGIAMTLCPYRDHDGTCTHSMNGTPECTPWVCPFQKVWSPCIR